MEILSVQGIGEIEPGQDLATVVADAIAHDPLLKTHLDAESLSSKDILVIAQKIVSKSENRYVRVKAAEPTKEAHRLAELTKKDPREIEIILSETDVVLRAVPGLIIVRDKRGFVLANAGIDRSNISNAEERVLLLPEAPDRSAQQIRAGLAEKLGTAPAVIISDSFGRAWRLGTVNVAIGVAGLPATIDECGLKDRTGRELRSTFIGFADAIAAAAGLVIGEAAEGTPVALVRGLDWTAPAQSAASILRPLDQDLFQ